MSKKRRARIRDRNRFRFETPLPAELTMERLYELSTLETLQYRSRLTYRVSSDRLGDSIYVQVRVMSGYQWTPSMLSRIIHVQIREVDPSRTIVEGELQIPPHIIVLGIALFAFGVVATPLLYFSGSMSTMEFLFIVGLSLFGLVKYILGRNDPHTAFLLIKGCIQPLAADRELIASRQQQQVDQLTNVMPAAKPAEDVHERG